MFYNRILLISHFRIPFQLKLLLSLAIILKIRNFGIIFAELYQVQQKLRPKLSRREILKELYEEQAESFTWSY